MLKRFGVSLNEDLLSKFDNMLEEEGYTNRSEAIRDLIRDALVKKDWLNDSIEIVGAVVMVYSHHQYKLAQKVTQTQHQSYKNVLSSLHVHLDSDNCLEVIVLKGKAKDIRQFGEKIISTKGVKYGRFIGATTGSTI